MAENQAGGVNDDKERASSGAPGAWVKDAQQADTSSTVERLRKRHAKFVRHLTHAEDGAREVEVLRGVVGE